MSVKGFARGITLLCAVSCVISPPALAAGRGHYPNGSAGAEAAQAIAVQFWHQNPCGGDISIGWSPMASDTYANSSWEIVTPGNRMVNCRVEFNSKLAFTWSRYCTVMVHEYGHLTGLNHSKDPNNIMYPRPKPLPACVAAAARRARASSASHR